MCYVSRIICLLTVSEGGVAFIDVWAIIPDPNVKSVHSINLLGYIIPFSF